MSSRSGGLDPRRVAEVVTTASEGGDRRCGSGYLLARGLILTAAHVVDGADSIRVRFNADQEGQWTAWAQAAWSDPDPGLDIAVLRILEETVDTPGVVPVMARVGFGRITRPPVECEAMGFPRFKVREDSVHLGADGGPTHALDDLAGQADALSHRGTILRLIGDSAGAAEDLSQATALFERLGNRLGQARALAHLGRIRQAAGDEAGAADARSRALALYQELADRPIRTIADDDARHERLDQAMALIGLGHMRMQAEDYQAAVEAHARALEIYREARSYDNEAWAMNLYAAVLAGADDTERALAAYRDALRLTRKVQHRDDEAIALEGIGACLVRSADGAREGTDYLNQALDAYRRLDMRPGIERVQARLDALAGP